MLVLSWERFSHPFFSFTVFFRCVFGLAHDEVHLSFRPKLPLIVIPDPDRAGRGLHQARSRSAQTRRGKKFKYSSCELLDQFVVWSMLSTMEHSTAQPSVVDTELKVFIDCSILIHGFASYQYST